MESTAVQTRRAGRVEVLRRLLHASRHPRPEAAAIGPMRTLSHFLRSAAYLETFREWYGNPCNPALQAELAARPSLVTCVVHPYINASWAAERKLAVIAAHYGLLRGRLAMLRHAAPLALADAGEGLTLQLEQPGKFAHEGESTLNLCSAGTRLYTLAFTIGEIGGRRVAYVGALQGMHSAGAVEIYHDLTRRLHGLRPRDLLVNAFRQFCAAQSVTRILAVGDAQRVSSSAYFEARDRVLSSYDAAWSECGGVAGDDGFFALEPQVIQRTAEEIPSRKRSLYRRRYAMLDALAQQIRRAVIAGAA